jgi:transcription initiation factor TFIIIB Brf1 subunit/transcription initiation factor TFIIB
MVHPSLAVLQWYLALAGENIERAHKLHSPVDNLLQMAAQQGKGLSSKRTALAAAKLYLALYDLALQRRACPERSRRVA